MAFRLILCIIILAIAAPSIAHDWYPIECCHGLDCAPVERAEIQDGGQIVVTSKNGTGVVPATLPRRESKDHRMHVCMRPSSTGGMRVICVFLPPPM